MFDWGRSEDSYNQTYSDDQSYSSDETYSDEYQPHQAKMSHEVLAGGASFAAFRAFEDHQRNEGKPVDHAFAKEVLAGFAGAEVDKLAETRGMDEYEKIKIKRQATDNAEQMYDDHYGNMGGDQFDPNMMPPQPQMEQHRRRRRDRDFQDDGFQGDQGFQDQYQQGGFQQDGFQQDGFQQGGFQGGPGFQGGYQQDYQGYDQYQDQQFNQY